MNFGRSLGECSILDDTEGNIKISDSRSRMTVGSAANRFREVQIMRYVTLAVTAIVLSAAYGAAEESGTADQQIAEAKALKGTKPS